MPRRCSTCRHPRRSEIDRALVAGVTFRTLADRFQLSETALKRHRAGHLPTHLSKAAEAASVVAAGDLLGQLANLRDRSVAIVDRAEAAGQLRTALAAIREARACLALLLEVEGAIGRSHVVRFSRSPEVVEFDDLLARLSPVSVAQLVAIADEAEMKPEPVDVDFSTAGHR